MPLKTGFSATLRRRPCITESYIGSSLWRILTIGLGVVVCVVPVPTGAASTESYRAAVLEHVRFGGFSDSVDAIVSANLRSYQVAAETASKHGVDIIVFPEFGIFPHTRENRSFVRDFGEDIPDPSRLGAQPNPCGRPDIFEDRTILSKLSCMAKSNRIFIVANMVDAKTCTSESCDSDATECNTVDDVCPEDGVFLHNTNVVFDRDGNLISRYYKRHLYFEFDLNEAREVRHVYFDTEFGRFTTFVCFDMSFYDSVDSVLSSGVVNVAYPTYWYDHQPFAIATQFQQAWAIAHGVNLLAANAHLPGTGTMGSGIYSGSRGALIYTHIPDGRDKLLIADVPTTPGNLEIPSNAKRFVIEGDNVVEVRDPESPDFGSDCAHVVLGLPENPAVDYRCALTNVSDYKFRKLEGNSGSIEVCSNELCCNLEYEADSMNDDFYLGSHSDTVKFYDAFQFETQACLLTRCSDESCSVFSTSSKTVFRRVTLRTQFLTPHVYPSVVHSDFRLAPTDLWSYDSENGLIYENSRSEDLVDAPLLSVGLYARRYDLDKILI